MGDFLGQENGQFSVGGSGQFPGVLNHGQQPVVTQSGYFPNGQPHKPKGKARGVFVGLLCLVLVAGLVTGGFFLLKKNRDGGDSDKATTYLSYKTNPDRAKQLTSIYQQVLSAGVEKLFGELQVDASQARYSLLDMDGDNDPELLVAVKDTAGSWVLKAVGASFTKNANELAKQIVFDGVANLGEIPNDDFTAVIRPNSDHFGFTVKPSEKTPEPVVIKLTGNKITTNKPATKPTVSPSETSTPSSATPAQISQAVKAEYQDNLLTNWAEVTDTKLITELEKTADNSIPMIQGTNLAELWAYQLQNINKIPMAKTYRLKYDLSGEFVNTTAESYAVDDINGDGYPELLIKSKISSGDYIDYQNKRLVPSSYKSFVYFLNVISYLPASGETKIFSYTQDGANIALGDKSSYNPIQLYAIDSPDNGLELAVKAEMSHLGLRSKLSLEASGLRVAELDSWSYGATSTAQKTSHHIVNFKMISANKFELAAGANPRIANSVSLATQAGLPETGLGGKVVKAMGQNKQAFSGTIKCMSEAELAKLVMPTDTTFQDSQYVDYAKRTACVLRMPMYTNFTGISGDAHSTNSNPAMLIKIAGDNVQAVKEKYSDKQVILLVSQAYFPSGQEPQGYSPTASKYEILD